MLAFPFKFELKIDKISLSLLIVCCEFAFNEFVEILNEYFLM